MSTKSSTRTDGWLLLAALLVAAPAFASKDDDYKAAQAAASAGKAEEAARLFCQLDPGFKDAGMMCGIMKKEAQKEVQKNEDRFQEGLKAFNEGRFDDAKQKFQNVRTGPRAEEAKQYVISRIPAAIQAKEREAAAGAESAANQKFDQGVQAYNRNDFSGARSLFQGVSGGKKGEADNYLNRMKQFESAMAEGDRLASAKNYKAAQGSYNEAATLKGDGPGNPREKAGQMASLASGSTTSPPVTTATTTTKPPPVTTTSTTTSPPVTRAPVVAAVKEAPKPKVDVGKLLAEAEAAKAKGDIASAKSKYIAVLAADERNVQAKVGLETLPKETGPTEKKASSEADVMLAKGIREYYQGLFEKAEVHIDDYLNVNGSKTGLSHFYMGASKLTRYYLNGEKDSGLKRDAEAAFRLAKQTAGFKPPGESFVSPKILKAYQDVSQ
jgi:tetratricopeptide (TPR) repeat protein